MIKNDNKVSVIIPVYNSEKHIEKCVSSVINQTYKNVEIILVNDGSKDNSPLICDSFSKNYTKVKVLHIENGGAGAARNAGVKLASGNYISFVDSDDWIHPTMIEIMLSALHQTNSKIVECDITYTEKYAFKTINDDINKITIKHENKLEALNRIINTSRFSVCVRIYEYDLIKNISFPENIISEDVYFTLDTILKIDSLIKVPYKYYYYHSNHESVTKKSYSLKTLDTIDSALYLQRKINANINDLTLLDNTRKFVLDVLVFNYNLLHHNYSFDKTLSHRKKIKDLVIQNYSINSSLRLKLVRFLPINIFGILIKFNTAIKKYL
tara:strand:- start:3184 stop:4158 length:975 start_codon:yes stop_codon:yes gene_type:complete